MTFKELFKNSGYKDQNILDITYLVCNFKRLTDLNGIEEFINLKKLYCHYNKIKSLEPIKNLTKLEILSCSHNKIESLEPLKYLTSLKELICYDNPIIPKTTVYIPFLRLTWLEWDNCIPIFKGMYLREIQEEIKRRNMNLLRNVHVSESYIKKFNNFINDI